MKFPELKRPYPPLELLEAGVRHAFIPAPDVSEWSQDVFLDETSKLHNPAHAHLLMASIGVLWTNAPCKRQMIPVAGMARLPRPNPVQDEWSKAMYWQQIEDWFDHRPDFLITLYAPYANEVDNVSFCALVEHELYHCALKTITNKGKPIWGIKGHDVEEFVGIVERYGAGAAAGKTLDLIAASRRKPLIGQAEAAAVCGTCMRLVA